MKRLKPKYEPIVYVRYYKNGDIAQTLKVNPARNTMQYWAGPGWPSVFEYTFHNEYVIYDNDGNCETLPLKTAKDFAKLMWTYKDAGYSLKNHAIPK